jgi:hypothetical protein
MPEWAQFREAITAGLPNTGQLLWLRTIEGWLTLAPQAARAALTEARKSSAPQLLYRSMVILNLTIEREAQIHTGPDSGPALQQLFSEVQQGTASNDRSQLAAKLSVLWELAGALLQEDPTLSQGPSDADLAKMNLQQAATLHLQAHRCGREPDCTRYSHQLFHRDRRRCPTRREGADSFHHVR